MVRALQDRRLTTGFSHNRRRMMAADIVERAQLFVGPDQIKHRDIDLALDEYPHHTLCRAAQPIWILRAGWNQPHSETASQRVDLIRDRDHLAGAVAWNRIFHALRFVVVVDGLLHRVLPVDRDAPVLPGHRTAGRAEQRAPGWLPRERM